MKIKILKSGAEVEVSAREGVCLGKLAEIAEVLRRHGFRTLSFCGNWSGSDVWVLRNVLSLALPDLRSWLEAASALGLEPSLNGDSRGFEATLLGPPTCHAVSSDPAEAARKVTEIWLSAGLPVTGGSLRKTLFELGAREER